MGQQRCVRRESCSEMCWELIQSHRMSWRGGRCLVGEPAAAAAGVEVEAWSDTARWLADQTCCSQSQMLTLQLLAKEGERREKIN